MIAKNIEMPSPSLATVYNCIAELKRGRTIVQVLKMIHIKGAQKVH